MTFETVVLIGCGGVGSYLLPPLATFVRRWKSKLILVDGDSWEERNSSRCFFTIPGVNKAAAMQQFCNLSSCIDDIIVIDRYIGYGERDNSISMEGLLTLCTPPTLIILCVDRDSTRSLICSYLENHYLFDYYLVNAANHDNKTDISVSVLDRGQVSSQYRMLGEQSLSLSRFPNIKNPSDLLPEMDCHAKAITQPQMVASNMAAVLKTLHLLETVTITYE